MNRLLEFTSGLQLYVMTESVSPTGDTVQLLDDILLALWDSIGLLSNNTFAGLQIRITVVLKITV